MFGTPWCPFRYFLVSFWLILVRLAPIPSVLVCFGKLWHRIDLKPGVGFWLSCWACIGWSPHTTTIWRPELDPGFISSTSEPVWSTYCLLPSCVQRKDFRGEQWVPYRLKSYWIWFNLFSAIERTSFKATSQLWIGLLRKLLQGWSLSGPVPNILKNQLLRNYKEGRAETFQNCLFIIAVA